MKKNFTSYYRPTESEIKESAKSAVFIFDTNSLLDFYRINPEIADKVLKVIEENKDRVYITRHTDKEYHLHHYQVPAQMSNTISMVSQHLNFDKIKAVLEDQFKYSKGCSFPSDLFKVYLNKLSKSYKEICEDVTNLQSQYDEKIRTHELQHRISRVFEDHIFPGLTKERIEEIITKIGPERYSKKTPPGYKDAGKATDVDDNNTYGDLIIWFEILDFVKQKPHDVFFVCRDEKEDWISVEGKWRIGPRIELIVEFREIAPDNIFHICSLTDFLEYFDKKETLSTDELRAVQSIPNTKSYIDLLLDDIPMLQGKMAGLDEFIDPLYAEKTRNSLQNIAPESFWSSLYHPSTATEKPSKIGQIDADSVDMNNETPVVE